MDADEFAEKIVDEVLAEEHLEFRKKRTTAFKELMSPGAVAELESWFRGCIYEIVQLWDMSIIGAETYLIAVVSECRRKKEDGDQELNFIRIFSVGNKLYLSVDMNRTIGSLRFSNEELAMEKKST